MASYSIGMTKGARPAPLSVCRKTGVLTLGWPLGGHRYCPSHPGCGFVSAPDLHLGRGGLVLSQGDYVGIAPLLSMCFLL